MKRDTIKILNKMDVKVEQFGLPFKFIPSDKNYINPITNPLCFLDFIHGSCNYKINISHVLALRQLILNKNVLLEVPENTYASEFSSVYALFLLLTKEGYIAIHSKDINYIYAIKDMYNSLPKELQVKDIDEILSRVKVKNKDISKIPDEKIMLHIFLYFNFNKDCNIHKDCQLLIINNRRMMKPYKKYVKDNFRNIERRFTNISYSYTDLGIDLENSCRFMISSTDNFN